MSKSEVTTIVLQLDTTEVELSVEEAVKALAGLQSIAKDTCSQISGAFNSALATLEAFKISADKLHGSVKSVAEWDFSSVLTELTEISDALDVILYRYPFSEVLLMKTGFQKADSLNGRRLLAKFLEGRKRS